MDMTAFATIITAFGTLGILAVSALMVRATNRMAKVSELTLKAGTTPQVVAYLQDHFHDSVAAYIAVVIENIGHGAAQNVVYRLDMEDREGQVLAREHNLANKQDVKIDFLPTGVKREMILGSTPQLYDSERDAAVLAPFKVTIHYENLNGEKFGPQTFTLDTNDFADRGSVAKSSIVDIETSLRSLPEIKSLMEKFTKQSTA